MTAVDRLPSDVMTAVLAEVRAYAAQADAEASFPARSLKVLRDSGLLGFLVPTSYGGWEQDVRAMVVAAQQLAGACLSTASVWVMHCQQVDALVRYATPALKERVLPSVARGDIYLASVTTEAVKGWSFLTARSPLVPRPDGYHLDRQAPVVSGGAHADGFLLTMRASPHAPDHAVSLVYVGRDQVTVEHTRNWNTLGMRGMENVALRLTGTVPGHQVVGDAAGFHVVAAESSIPLAHLGLSACWLGAAREAFGALLRHLRSPQRGGGPDISSDLVRERLARIRLDLELVHAYLLRVADEIVELRDTARSLSTGVTQIHVNSLKLAASDLCFRAVDRMVDLAGLSVGYSTDSPVPLERHLRDLRSASLNYANDRLWTVNGALSLVDTAVSLA
ncbi:MULTISPECIES: acyl-CoA dehydrogenase family protein [unclassified Streptomyces]|uniref:acyl-CoA dehydrogenase family protein n=1 Tax=unclassified Streptomyces TaxID=2593676 RepID=UPI002366F415|nr:MULTISPECIES: acyl-CoA dehydrogenase family protein [unclassified Streptomyces]MDF3139840.1 acyl-CoA/acyl-ACP dehydrogenase [Streptomyces sp. T21Q-yed]WDF41898.1 acyl-CoA/acyl-ACP dehydrogenase [Streptomyces sp. T12]